MELRISTALLAAALVLPQSATAALEPQQVFSADYAVSFLGLTVARSTVVSRFGATSYAVDGSIRSAGLAAFFDSTTARTAVSGKIGKGGVSPDSYSVDYVYGNKNKKTSLQFAKGNVVKIANSPPLPPRRQDWVAVDAKELLAVADPISATLIEAKDARSVCGRTIKAFDGEIRADLALSYVDDRAGLDRRARSRGSHLPGAFQAGRGLSSRQQVDPVPVDQKQDHAEVCTARQNRHICADSSDGGHQGRHVHDPRQAP